jgi:AraC-like DNA-binding protein
LKKVPIYNLQTISCKSSKIGNIEFLRFEDHLKNIDDVNFPHRHDFYYLLYISKGRGSHTIDFKSYPVKPGQLFFMSPGQIHEWDIKPNTKGFTLFFNKDLFLSNTFKIEEQWPFFHSLFYEPVFQLKLKDKIEIENWFELILKEYQLAGKKQDDVVKHLLSSFLYKINSVFNLSDNFLQTGKSDILRKYELLINEYFNKQQHLSFYANKLNISQNYLNALCKNLVGKSAKHLLLNRVLLEAKRLLHHSELNINDISDYLNFKSTSYFIRFFKKAEGKTPLAFKMQK